MLSLSRYAFSSVSKVRIRRTAWDTAQCPVTTFSQVGESASSKSAMNTDAPLLSALIIIFGSAGPVISTRRSSRSAGAGATVQVESRLSIGLGRKSGTSPASILAWRRCRSSSSRSLSALNERWSCATKSRASGVRISAACAAPLVSSTPGGVMIMRPLSPTTPSARGPAGRSIA
jgi:hypothetical protein